MMSKTNRLFLILFFFASAASAQILEVDSERVGDVVNRPPHLGLTLSGTSGLLTIPTPEFQDERKVAFSYKGGITKTDVTFNDTRYRAEKNEHFTSAALSIQPNLEFSVFHLDFERCANPYLEGLTYDEDATAYGLKYSTHNGKQDMCMGITFAPMDMEELMLADLAQVEALRAAYITVSEEIFKGFMGYLSLKECFTKKQEIKLSNGQRYSIPRKEFLVGGVGLEYSMTEAFSLMCESQFFNYRDIFRDDSVRQSFNAGIRIGGPNIQLEVMGLSLNRDPNTIFGVTTGF